MKALIVAGGEAPSRALLLDCMRDARVYCADSGANALFAQGLFPDVLLGDMDSIAPDAYAAYASKGVRLIRLQPEKDDTDTEAVLALAIAEGFREIRLLGALGRRLDHQLANLALLLYARKRGAELEILDDAQSVRLLREEDCICGRIGQTFSLLPLGGDAKAHALEGVQYPLDHLALPADSTIGISNVLTKEKASVRVEAGNIMLILQNIIV